MNEERRAYSTMTFPEVMIGEPDANRLIDEENIGVLVPGIGIE